MNILHEDTRNLIIGLSFPEAHEAMGKTQCEVYALMLQLSLNSCTQEEADERLAKMVSDIRSKLGV